MLVTLRGVPLRIQPEPDTKPPNDAAKDPFGSRDDAAVDSELSLFGVDALPIKGALPNKYFNSQKSISEADLSLLVLTARIDAASSATCERMIHDAVETEANGLWGRAYVDIANKHPEGDKWLEGVVTQNLGAGIPTVVDRFNDTLPKNYPMNEASLYYGWYDWNLSGPFLNPKFHFRKGAVAMHLHSFSAEQLRDPSKNWSAGLLEKGAAVTIGNVYEPYLQLTHQFDIIHKRLLAGFTWVEAAWMAMPVASWQAIVLGDPLYRPFLHFDATNKHLKEDSAEAAVWFRNAKDHFTKPEDKLRQDFNLIAIQRSLPNGKSQAVQALREAKTRYGSIPEADGLSAWLDILDPPAPPPAVPAATPPLDPPPAKTPPSKTPGKVTPSRSNQR